ncbi:hypothetical protein Srufu_032080 [Streptomyces libani subsp. rufus]|nr:hypothetical protein Srufu_032080 [Streptomyces libani subsp. rufus]
MSATNSGRTPYIPVSAGSLCGVAGGWVWAWVRVAVGCGRCAYGLWVVGSEGTPGNPPPASGREVPPRRGRRGSQRLEAPLFAPGPAGGSPDIPSALRLCAAAPPYG